MDGARFDHLTRSLARGTSRRGLLKGLAAGLLGGVTGLHGTEADAQRATRQADGAPCTRATDCGSFLCVDGVCCDTACTGQCESCVSGTCSPVTGSPAPGKPACSGSGPCAATCDGVTTSHCAAAPGADTVCASPTCAAGVLTTSACGGNGACVATTTNCAPFGCDPTGTACATGCQRDDECGPGSHCDDGACLPDEGIGTACGEDSDCQSGMCVDSVCCAERCDACQACNLPGDEGFCGPAPDGGSCGADGTGRCCEGGCVDPLTDVEHCGGCDQTCLGVPNGVAVCDQGVCAIECLPGLTQCAGDGPCVICRGPTDCPPPADPCQVATCTDGVCGYVPADPTTPCRPGSCADGEAIRPAACGDATTCPAEERIECGLFTCNDDATACRDSCTETSHCVPGTHCDGGACVPDEGLGDPCETTTNCGAGVCVGGVCCVDECVAPEHGTATCSTDGLTCGFTCNDGYARCGTACIADDACCTPADCIPDPAQCQGTATCTDGVCDFAPVDDGVTCVGERICCGGLCCDTDQECLAGSCVPSCPICQVYDQAAGACVAVPTDPITRCPQPCFTGGGICAGGVCNPIGQPLETGAICHPDACSQGTCFGIECQNVGPLTCHHLDTDCRVGVCDPVSGCHSVNRENGIECPPTRPCAASSTCFNGACFSAGMAPEDTPCDLDACNVNGVCRGGMCNFTEPFDCGPCRTCQDGACVPGNGGAFCTAGCKPGFCSSGQCFIIIQPGDPPPCPDCQTCQDNACVADPTQDDQACGAAGFLCCDGACVSSTTTDHCGACGVACSDPLDTCMDGECCRAAGSDCTDGSECCAEPGVPSGQCIGGICGGSGAFCVGDGVCASGSCCDFACCAVGTTCLDAFPELDPSCVACISPGLPCNRVTNLCCQDGGETQCAPRFLNFPDEDYCCRPLGGSCTSPNQCCLVDDDQNEPTAVHCNEGICGSKGAFCKGLHIGCASDNICCNGTCCGDGEICVDGACVAGVCKLLGEVCDPTDMECCQDVDATVCDTIPGVIGATCRRAAGSSCAADSDCANSLNCSTDGICGGSSPGAQCESDSDCGNAVCCSVCCRPGDDCAVDIDGGGVCVPAVCSEEGESCNPSIHFDDCCGDLACVDGTCREASPDCDAQGLVECDGECCVACCEFVIAGVPQDKQCCPIPCTATPPLGEICLS